MSKRSSQGPEVIPGVVWELVEQQRFTGTVERAVCPPHGGGEPLCFLRSWEGQPEIVSLLCHLLRNKNS